jgi:hypothetical protein
MGNSTQHSCREWCTDDRYGRRHPEYKPLLCISICILTMSLQFSLYWVSCHLRIEGHLPPLCSFLGHCSVLSTDMSPLGHTSPYRIVPNGGRSSSWLRFCSQRECSFDLWWRPVDAKIYCRFVFIVVFLLNLILVALDSSGAVPFGTGLNQLCGIHINLPSRHHARHRIPLVRDQRSSRVPRRVLRH